MPDQTNQSTNVPQADSAPAHRSLSTFSTPVLITGIAILLAVISLGYWAFTTLTAQSAAPAKIYTIGVLYYPQQTDAVIGFQQHMEALGYKVGVNVNYDLFKIAVGPTSADEFAAAAGRMIDAHEDMIFATFEDEAQIALAESKKKNSDLPIVFLTRFHDPVEYGLVASYTSSGNNATGVATDVPQTVERSLGFFKEINPHFKNIGVFTDGFMVPGVGDAYLAELKKQAPKFGVQVVEFKTSLPPPQAEAEFHRIADTIKKGDIDGIFHIAGHFIGPQETLENEVATRLKIPMEAPYEDLPNGGMFSYSDSTMLAGVEAAVLADKIFKGAKPADIPIAFTTKDVLTLILGRARDAGITFPDSMLFIATNKFENGSDFPEALHER